MKVVLISFLVSCATALKERHPVQRQLQKTVYEEQGKDLQDKHCTTVYENKCNTKQERECSVFYEKQYNKEIHCQCATKYDTVCDVVPARSFSEVFDEDCQTVTDRNCKPEVDKV